MQTALPGKSLMWGVISGSKDRRLKVIHSLSSSCVNSVIVTLSTHEDCSLGNVFYQLKGCYRTYNGGQDGQWLWVATSDHQASQAAASKYPWINMPPTQWYTSIPLCPLSCWIATIMLEFSKLKAGAWVVLAAAPTELNVMDRCEGSYEALSQL